MRGGAKRRKAIVRNLVAALVQHGEITTTLAQALVVRSQVDRLLRYARGGALHGRRLIAAFLSGSALVNKLVDEITPRFGQRTSGFTRLIKLGKRLGDSVPMVRIKFVEFSESLPVPVKKTSQPSVSSPKEGKKETKGK